MPSVLEPRLPAGERQRGGQGFRAWREPARCAARRWMRGSRSGTCTPASCSRTCAPAPRLATRSPRSDLTSWPPRSITNLAPRAVAVAVAPSTSGLGTRAVVEEVLLRVNSQHALQGSLLLPRLLACCQLAHGALGGVSGVRGAVRRPCSRLRACSSMRTGTLTRHWDRCGECRAWRELRGLLGELDSCKSDAEVISSLPEAPWEVLLNSKLLHERAKGSGSTWASYIQALPEFVFLPLLFTDFELISIQDVSVQEEVQWLRRFTESSFQALISEEVAGSKFTKYVVYSSACEVAVERSMRHVLVPFVTSSFEPNKKGRRKLVNFLPWYCSRVVKAIDQSP